MAGLIATPVSKIRLLDFLLHCDKNLNILHKRTLASAFVRRRRGRRERSHI
jgi:hypothetical protein